MTSVLFHVLLLATLLSWYLPKKPAAETAAVSSPSTSTKPQTPKKLPEINVPAAQIQASVESQIESVATKSDLVKLKELDQNFKRLDNNSDEQSTNAVANAVAESMGLDRQQYQAKPTSPGLSFNPSTAQLKDVSRTQNDAGEFQYEALMVDSNGNEQTVAISEVEGQPAYEMFEKLKNYPMAQGIYQQLVMPMLQKMLEEKE